ncbi:hypothetical protein SISNIDRAFT_490935 [Sistotremastrum niveocremeum HHB9708]|uniref:BTB domain-containing protein n=1 Tax=Sistotremastrum niveocremeum HHB9708 TaxID=1314777 RepID=A0A164NCR3_9AGAM|nr:hypothetical protein SISNIDRAFT_490935 [Sistotremastrum niveocremeum HHB9708]
MECNDLLTQVSATDIDEHYAKNKWGKSARHYDPGGAITARAGSLIFRFNPFLLQSLSPIFRDMFGVIQSPTDGSPMRPMVLQDNAEEFKALMDWIFHENLTPQAWLFCLSKATKYYIKPARNEAIVHVWNSSLPAYAKLRLARRYRISQWIAPCMLELFKIPQQQWTANLIVHVGADVSAICIRTGAKLQAWRFQTAWASPVFIHDMLAPCAKSRKLKDLCEANWLPTWRAVMSPLRAEVLPGYKIPDISGRQQLDVLEKFEIPDLDPRCKALSIAKLKRERTMLEDEDLKILAVAEGIEACNLLDWDQEYDNFQMESASAIAEGVLPPGDILELALVA